MKDGEGRRRQKENNGTAGQCTGRAGNVMLTLAVIAVNVLLMGICFDFYYDLNDDTMMHDIMSGIYTGTPDGHNMQTLYPLGALIALCYRLCKTVPWFGLFLCLCQFGSFYLIGVRMCGCRHMIGSARRKIMTLFLLSLYMWGVCLPHLINIQYTISCAILSAAAVFLFFTTPDGLEPGQFLRWNLPSVLLVIVAYQLRSEMLLLTFPFIGLAGLYRLIEEKKIFVKENLYRYGGVLGMILAGMALSFMTDSAAYKSVEWKAFRAFFDARTTVYDFYPELITDEAYGEALTALGVEPYRQPLLRNYNFGLDDDMDPETLMTLADYAKGTLRREKDWKKITGSGLRNYVYRTFHSEDAPYNIIVLCAYAAVLLLGVMRCRPGHKYSVFWKLLLLAAVRSALWMFLLLRGRAPERITHSLYIVEFVFLAGMFVRMLLCPVDSGEKNGKNSKEDENLVPSYILRGALRCVAALGVIFMILSLPKNLTRVQADQDYREQVNGDWRRIDDYCRSRRENFYFEDVYSTVAFSQKLFADRDYSCANYDIMGGWMCKSPLYQKKISLYGIDSVQEALLTKENVYLIMSDAEAALQNFDWITAYYGGQGRIVTVEKTDVIGESYGVYRVVLQDKE